jgi:hypothetical protein
MSKTEAGPSANALSLAFGVDDDGDAEGDAGEPAAVPSSLRAT